MLGPGFGVFEYIPGPLCCGARLDWRNEWWD